MTGIASILLALLLASCGGGHAQTPLTVYAASSLTEVFEELEPDARFNFAGSDELATQLREGASADVFAAASMPYAHALAEEGLVERPRIFATNSLAVVVPTDNPAEIRTLDDVARPGVRLVVAAEGVPAGDYARAVLAKAGRLDVLTRVVSEEEDVKGVIGKVRLGEADAGFVYTTDARAAAGNVATVAIPARFQVPIAYPVAVVRAAEHPDRARRFVALLRSERGRRLLRAAGFGVP